MRVALDAMGGDHAPSPNITGALDALDANPALEVTLVGQQPQIESILEQGSRCSGRLRIVASDGFVRMDEKPTEALRRKPDCSIARCWNLMASREVDAVVSAGNTGAVVASGLRTRLFLKGVKRPGIAVALPTLKGQSILMDVGANPAARPLHLYQYGVMGAIYARDMLGIDNPRIGLMNIGSEESKGNDLYRETHQFLSNSALRDSYVGNIEGRGLYQGEADVLICEGFVGNVVLKVSEGMAEFMLRAVSADILELLDVERGKATRAFDEFSTRYQYREAGGAPLLGIDGICIICHGSSDARSIANAITAATSFKDRQINSQIVAELRENNHS
jgi:glycerol-3-phosphate acyltransferase PlsX